LWHGRREVLATITTETSFLLSVKCMPPMAVAYTENVITLAVAWIRNAAK
jgi:hypothetical protein